jgi:FKBP-type peptidyl-prolyl cis-trans isomerase
MVRGILIISIFCSTISCTSNVIKESQKKEVLKVTDKKNNNSKGKTALNSDDLAISSSRTYENGIDISWLSHGKGEKVKKGDVILIDYKVTLADGKIIDGNHLIRKASFPFIVGYQMQTKGWDFALEQLKIGDFARVKIPSELARGVKGIKKEGSKEWFVPPNSVNYLSIRVIKKQVPTRVIDGVKVWVFEENKENKIKFGEKNAIVFHCMISSQSNPIYYNSYSSNSPYTLILSDKGIIPGLKKALINAKKADRMYIVVPSVEAYGSKGSEGFVKPNEDLFYNVLVMDVVKK